MSKHANTPWYAGMNLWFPERGRTYTIKQVNELGGGYGGDTVELAGDVDLASDGIQPGDWYAIHAIRPGLRVNVASHFTYRAQPLDGSTQPSANGTGDIELTVPSGGGPDQ